MIYLMGKYHEGDWIAAALFLILGAAAFIALFIAERPESEDEKELLSKYRKSFDKINQR